MELLQTLYQLEVMITLRETVFWSDSYRGAQSKKCQLDREWTQWAIIHPNVSHKITCFSFVFKMHRFLQENIKMVIIINSNFILFPFLYQI